MSAKASCAHLVDFKKDEIKSFRVLHQVFVVSSEHESKIAKLKNAFCHVCKRLGPHLHACIHCVFFGCHKHIRDHAKGKKHCFTMELNYGQLHCIRCNDYVYNAGLDKIAFENTMSAKKCAKRVLYWNASLEPSFDAKMLSPKRICITPDSTRGLRGLINLGSTCFVNSIVQILMNMPLLREFFLSDRHRCKGAPGSCTVCELSYLYQEFYKGQLLPLALHRLVYMIWLRDERLAGDTQQDVHDFFIATLEALHHDGQEDFLSFQASNKLGKCQSIIDQIFGGLLQSDVMCKGCRSVSTTVDPVWDFSLELNHVAECKLSLMDCLERFTYTEQLELKDNFICSTCESIQEATKQLTVKTLPNVICFHLKRILASADFDPKKFKAKKVETKIETKKIKTEVIFPEMLDMTPYMSQRKELLFSVIPNDNRYSLFAVVNHSGASDTGHYISYVRHQRDFWYKCNDHYISRATIDQVLASEGYLLFYHKHILGYD